MFFLLIFLQLQIINRTTTEPVPSFFPFLLFSYLFSYCCKYWIKQQLNSTFFRFLSYSLLRKRTSTHYFKCWFGSENIKRRITIIFRIKNIKKKKKKKKEKEEQKMIQERKKQQKSNPTLQLFSKYVLAISTLLERH